MRYGPAVLLLLAAAPALCQPAPAAPATAPRTPDDARLIAAVDAAAARVLADKAAAGFVVGIVQGGRVRLVRGYGHADLENRTPVMERTVFRIGSVTKEFTAAAILLLAEQGKLSVDDPLAKYLPDFPRGGEVTIRHLLNHTSGIRNYTSVPDFATASMRQEFTTDGMVALIRRSDPLYDFDPGTSYAYSNSGYLLLGAIVEKVSGQPYAQFLKANLLDPLGLRDTGIDDLAEIVPNRANGYEKAAESRTGFANASPISMSVAAAAGAMRSTAADLLTWHAALLGGRVLKPASLATMTAPGRLKDGRLPVPAPPAAGTPPRPPSSYGFGIMTGGQPGRRTIGHGGSINGFNASLNTFPDDDMTVVLLTNTGGGVAGVGPPIIDAIFAARGASGAGTRTR